MAYPFGKNRGRRILLSFLTAFLASGAALAQQGTSCGPVPPAPVDLELAGFYADSGRGGSASRIDKTRLAEYLEATRSLIAWGNAANRLADDFLKNAHAESARCAITYVDEWAKAGALLGRMGDAEHRQGHAVQKWLLAEAAAVYFKVQGQADAAQNERILRWLAGVAKPVKAFWETNPDTLQSSKNNHYAWSGVAVMQVAVLTADRDGRRWARKTFDHVLDGLDADGFHPEELRRGKKALHYHLFTLAPLVYMAKLSQLDGENWLEDARLKRMIEAVTGAAEDPAILEKRTGKAQESFNAHPWNWGWYRILPDGDRCHQRFETLMKTGKGQKSVRYLGGDLQLFRDLVDQRMAAAGSR